MPEQFDNAARDIVQAAPSISVCIHIERTTRIAIAPGAITFDGDDYGRVDLFASRDRMIALRDKIDAYLEGESDGD